MRLTFLGLSIGAYLLVGLFACEQVKTSSSTPAGKSSFSSPNTSNMAASEQPSEASGKPSGSKEDFVCGKDSPPLVSFQAEGKVFKFCQAGQWVELPLAGLRNRKEHQPGASKPRLSSPRKTLQRANAQVNAQVNAQPPKKVKSKNSSFYCRPSVQGDDSFHCSMQTPTSAVAQ